MEKNALFYGFIGFIIGALVTVAVSSNKSDAPNMEKAGDKKMEAADEATMSMMQMVKELEGKTGEEFDRKFIKLMTEHHQGAIDMAKSAQKNAAHDEIKKLADEIIKAQTAEIDKMKEWKKSWGYEK